MIISATFTPLRPVYVLTEFSAEEVQGMTIAHNGEVFNGQADDAEDVHDSQQ